jgi:site-specific recombinase XerD
LSSLCPGVPLWKVELKDYLRWIEVEREKGHAGRTLAKNVSHLRGFLDYAWRCGRSDRNVLDGFTIQDRSPSCPPRVLTVDEARRLVDACPRETARDRRDRMMVLLLYGCGLRTQELRDLRVPDVDTEHRQLQVHGKGDRQRVVPIPGAVFTELLSYLLERSWKRGPLFRLEGRRGVVSSFEVCDAVRHAAGRAGIPWKVTPKTLRHSYATHLMDRGVGLAVIARLLGHRTPTETGVYLHAFRDRKREAVSRLPEARPRQEGEDT